MVVDDADLVGFAGLPPEHEPPLIVDADAVQPLQVATQSFETVNEVLILGEHDRVRFASRKEDLGVDRAVETQLLDVQDHEIELLREPSRQGGRELCINPDRRAASTG